MREPISISLFGFPAIKLAEKDISFSSHKVLALCCYLVMNPGMTSRDKLVGLFWGDAPEDKARTSLRSALYNIQQQLPGLLQVSRKEVSISNNIPLSVDVWQFEQNITTDAAAIKHYQAELMDGLHIPGAPEFEHWLLIERQRLHQIAVKHLEVIPNIAAAQKLISLEPWREDAYRYVMRFEARQRNYNAALKTYQQLRQYLRQELDIEPSDQTQSLASRIHHLRNHPHHNLPTPLMPLIGREAKLNALSQQMAHTQTLTLMGMGGVGKTHLAFHLGQRLITEFMDGVWFIPLIEISNVADLPRLLAQIMHSEEINDYECLLILDNAEHLLRDNQLVGFIHTLMKNAPAIRMVITSREYLNFPGEVVYPLDGLTDSRLLFEAVAKRHNAQFTLSTEAQKLVDAFCTQVEGLPLAIELAASTVHWQSLLTLDVTGIVERHRSLDAMVAYSWSLLHVTQQTAMMQLAIIRGNFTLEAAHAIAQVSPLTLKQLVEKSLLRHHGDDYSIHEVIRQYALSQITPELMVISKDQHREYFFNLFVSHLDDLQNSNFASAFQRLTNQLNNFVDAWEWAISQNQITAFSPSLFEALQHLLADRGYNSLYLQLAKQAVDVLQEGELYICATLTYLYGLNWYAKDFEQFCLLANQLEQELRSADYPYWLAQCIKLKGWYYQYHQMDLARAEQCFTEAYQLLTEANAIHERARVLNDLGLVTQNPETWQQALVISYQLDDPRLEAVLCCNLAEYNLEHGQIDAAEEQFMQALALHSDHYGVLLSAYSGLATIYLEKGDIEAALNMAQQALESAKTHNQKGDLVSGYVTLARVFIAMKRIKAAHQQLQIALRLAHMEQDEEAIQQIQQMKLSLQTPRKPRNQ